MALYTQRYRKYRGEEHASGARLCKAWIVRRIVLRGRGPRLPLDRLILLAIIERMGNSDSSFPSLLKIARDVGPAFKRPRKGGSGGGVHPDTVRKRVDALAREGWLVRSVTSTGGQGWLANSYFAAVPPALVRFVENPALLDAHDQTEHREPGPAEPGDSQISGNTPGSIVPASPLATASVPGSSEPDTHRLNGKRPGSQGEDPGSRTRRNRVPRSKDPGSVVPDQGPPSEVINVRTASIEGRLAPPARHSPELENQHRDQDQERDRKIDFAILNLPDYSDAEIKKQVRDATEEDVKRRRAALAKAGTSASPTSTTTSSPAAPPP